jgi:RNA polymerase sporulation-specific sigma factor
MFDPGIFAVLKDFFCFAGYISGSTAFPKPLNSAEEKEYLEKLKNGDAEAKNILIERNLRLVAHIAKKYTTSLSEQDELISVGTLGLIKAVQTFHLDKGVRFSTYASKCIANEILMQFRSQKKTASDVSMNDPIDTGHTGNPVTIMDTLASEDTITDDVDLKIKSEKLYKYMDGLDPRERQVIILRYGLCGEGPLSQMEIAGRMGISRSYVSRIEKKAVEYLRRQFRKG